MLERARSLFLPFSLSLLSAALIAQNFFLLPESWRLLPVIFIMLGISILWRGNEAANDHSRAIGQNRRFRITKADSISATLIIDSGPSDVHLNATTDKIPTGATSQSSTLLAGSFAPDPPPIHRHFQHATIQLHRRQLNGLDWSNWRLNLAPELFWHFEIRSWLGDLWLNCSELTLEGGSCSSVMGTLRITPPARATGPLTLRNALGDIHVSVPPDRSCRIHIHHNRYTRFHSNELRYVPRGHGIYVAGSLAESAQPVLLELHPGLGDVYLE